MWRTFYTDPARSFEHFKVAAYESSPKGQPAYHHVNRVRVELGPESQSTLLVRVAHPSRPSPHDAEWLLAQPAFRLLAGLSPA